MWAPKLLLSPVKIRILCLKTTQICPKIAFLVILGQALPAQEGDGLQFDLDL